MRILFVMTAPYPPQAYGGARITTHDYCRLLRQRGKHHTAVLCQINRGGRLWLKNRIRSRLTGLRYPADRGLGYPVYRGWDPIAGIPEVARRFVPDVAVANAGQTGSVVRALVANGIPTVAQVSTVEFDRMGAPLPSDPRVAYVANSRFTAGQLKRSLGFDSTVVPPLVVPEHYAGCAGGASVLHVNPRESKGVDITLRLAERRPDIPFDIVEAWGVTEQVRRHRARAASLGNVTWHASVPDMRQLYRRARVVMVPSRWAEAWGRVATEAQVNGIPVIASNLGGLPEAVGPGGILVDPDADIREWEHALTRLWDDERGYQELAAAARRYSRRPEIQPEMLVSRFEGILERHREAIGSG